MSFTVERKRRQPGAVPPSQAPKASTRPMSREEITTAVADIKDTARRLRPPLNQKPNAFHEDKDELVKMAERLEDALRGNRPLRC